MPCDWRRVIFSFAHPAFPRHFIREMQSATRNPQSKNTDGRWFLIAVGLATALLGALFVWLMARSYLRAKEMHGWPEVPCVILSSVIVERLHDPESPVEYRLDILFGYVWEGEPRTGDRVTLRGNPWTSKLPLAENRAAEYPPGLETTCRVDPENPDFAVLRPDSLAPGYSIWFPALFVIGGLGMAVRAAKGPPAETPASSGGRSQSNAKPLRHDPRRDPR